MDMTTPAADAGTATPAMIAELRRLVHKGNQRWKRLVILKAGGLMIAAPLGYLWLVFLLDNVLHLSTAGRMIALLIFFGGVVWMIARLAAHWRQLHFSEDQVALAIEHRTPGRMENRLINSIQLARQTQDDVSVAVVQENYRHLQQIHWQQAARSAPAVIHMTLAAFLVVIGLLFWTLQHDRFSNAATRIFLPFSHVTPLYRTRLAVEPGDVTAKPGDDVTIRIRVSGQIPPKIAVLKNTQDERTSDEMAVPRATATLSYTFKAVNQSIIYAVRGGDYVSPYYTIEIPIFSELKQLSVVFHYPAYTRLPDRKQESAGGDLEALYGTRATLRFSLSQPALEAALRLEKPGLPASAARPTITPQVSAAAVGTDPPAPAPSQPLKRIRATEFEGEIAFKDITGYKLEAWQAGRSPALSKTYEVRVVADRAPELQLAGIDERTEVMTDSLLPLTVVAHDDFGLADVALFCRRGGGRTDTAPAGAAATNAWQILIAWPIADNALAYTTNYTLPVAALDGVEGDNYDLALGGKDNDPMKSGSWTMGQSCQILIGGVGAALQVLYEQILRAEAGLQGVIQAQEQAMNQAQEWSRKFDPAAGLRWDDQKTLAEFAAAMRAQAQNQASIRQTTAEAARQIVEQAGNLRLSAGLLADTEMVRAIRVLETVARHDTPQGQRAALGDARLIQERTLRSLRDILDQYSAFRKNWELYNMTPFTKMLVERQQRMRAESLTYSGLATTAADTLLRNGTNRRQLKLLALSELTQQTFCGLSQRTDAVDPALTEAFRHAATTFDASGLKTKMRQAADCLTAGQWADAATHQQDAAAALTGIYQQLVKAQTEAARRALTELQAVAESSVAAQKELARLKAGTREQLLTADLTGVDLAEIVCLRKIVEDAKNKIHPAEEDKILPAKWDENLRNNMGGSKPTNSDFSILKLSDKLKGGMRNPDFSDREGNRMKVEPLDKFQDLVGDLLKEADELRDQYETYNLNKAGQGVEAGDPGKSGGELNAVNAAAATGNKKPPSQNVGGASRSGRQGARAHGLVVGDESINRRGRDEAQEGQEQVPDQAGKIHETKSADSQKDVSTGYGGKEVVSSEESSFSTKDAGEWKDEIADKMKAPQARNLLVERQGKPLDPRIAEKLRDLIGKQEQVIERIKTIKKELDNLYLPTDDLDETVKQLNANLDRLKQAPDAEVIRSQLEVIDKLKGGIVVFNRPASEFQPSVVRDQRVRGQILDEPAWQALPGYETAVKRYYQKLVEP